MDIRAFEVQHYHKQVDRVVAQLRRVANEIEREGHRVENGIGAPPFGWAARGVVHTLLWGVANTNLDSVVDAAAAADREAQDHDASS